MGKFITVGMTAHPITPYVWTPRTSKPRFVMVSPSSTSTTISSLESGFVSSAPTTAGEAVTTPDLDHVSAASTTAGEAPITSTADTSASTGEAANTSEVEMKRSVVNMSVIETERGEPITSVIETERDTPITSAMKMDHSAPITSVVEKKRSVERSRPLSINLTTIRRTLGLTPEEFSRPIIDDGEALINRLETGFSRASAEIIDLIVTPWTICRDYLFTGSGPMFEKDATESQEKYVILLIRLLKTYLSVATFDRRGTQYWKGSLVNDISRLVDVEKLDGAGMSRIVRVLYDFLDYEQFTEILERFGR